MNGSWIWGHGSSTVSHELFIARSWPDHDAWIHVHDPTMPWPDHNLIKIRSSLYRVATSGDEVFHHLFMVQPSMNETWMFTKIIFTICSWLWWSYSRNGHNLITMSTAHHERIMKYSWKWCWVGAARLFICYSWPFMSVFMTMNSHERFVKSSWTGSDRILNGSWSGHG